MLAAYFGTGAVTPEPKRRLVSGRLSVDRPTTTLRLLVPSSQYHLQRARLGRCLDSPRAGPDIDLTGDRGDYLRHWAGKKYKRLRAYKRFKRWWDGLIARQPGLFAQRQWAHAF